MPPRLQTWLTPGTITSLISTVLVIGSFVGVSNYRAIVQDKEWDEFRSAIHIQLTEYKKTTDDNLSRIEKRLDGMSKDAIENARLQARFDALEKDIERLTNDNRELNGKVQAQYDQVTTRLARTEGQLRKDN